MKRKTAICFLIFLTAVMCYGQKKDTANIYRLPHNSIYIEGLGVTFLYSINYERVFNVKRFFISPRIGWSYFKIIEDQTFFTPLLCNFGVRCYKGLYVEMGAGVNLIISKPPAYHHPAHNIYVSHLGAANIGIRFQGKRGLLLRAGFTPLIMYYKWDGWTLLPMAGISFGWSFGRKYK